MKLHYALPVVSDDSVRNLVRYFEFPLTLAIKRERLEDKAGVVPWGTVPTAPIYHYVGCGDHSHVFKCKCRVISPGVKYESWLTWTQ